MTEYLKVLVPDWVDEDITVLINRRRKSRRKVGAILTLKKGPKLVSVYKTGAQEQEIDLNGTTPTEPLLVTIEIKPS